MNVTGDYGKELERLEILMQAPQLREVCKELFFEDWIYEWDARYFCMYF